MSVERPVHSTTSHMASKTPHGISRSRIVDRTLLTVFLLFIGLPIGWSVGYSLLYSFGLIGHLSSGATLRHWSAAISTGGLGPSVIYSISIASLSTTLAIVGALISVIAFPDARRDRFFLAAVCFPFATPAAVMALLTYQLWNPGGYVSRWSAWIGLVRSPADFPVLVNDPWSIGLVGAQVAVTWPLLMLFLHRTWSAARIDRFCRLAESLGASAWQAKWRVALPMLWSRVRPLCVLSFLTNLGAYELPWVLGRQSPQMLSVFTQRRFGQFDLDQRPQAFVLAVVYFLLLGAGVALMVILRRRST